MYTLYSKYARSQEIIQSGDVKGRTRQYKEKPFRQILKGIKSLELIFYFTSGTRAKARFIAARSRSFCSCVPMVTRKASITGSAGAMDPPFPLHNFLLGAGRYGLTQLANLEQLPAAGAVVIVAPLKLVDGTGSPARVLALNPR